MICCHARNLFREEEEKEEEEEEEEEDRVECDALHIAWHIVLSSF